MRRPRDEGSKPQGDRGVILNLTLSGDGVWNAIYSVQATVGKARQSLRLSIDTGSSDIWLASTSCSSSACSGAHTSLYNPASALQTGQIISLTYLGGSVDGPIIWDNLTIGPYSIPAQAMVSASQVTDELLSSDFVGLLGLALPMNSNIARRIPPTESDAPDGATFQQNIFGLTPIDTAPAQRFLGVSLERPGSSHIPSLLTIGKHPGNLLPDFDPSKINFMSLIPSPVGDTYWKVSLDAITGWVDSSPRPVNLEASAAVTNVDFPVAILDTGGSIILTTRDIADAIYGAWDIGPGSDGNYYIPCTTPMNMTISLGNMGPIPIHPLDLTAQPPNSNIPSVTDTCMGIIQASDQLDGVADMVLGVAFMRNVYSVLSSDPSNSTDNDTNLNINEEISPMLGLLSLTDPTTALKEFHTVRVLGQSLEPSSNSVNTGTVVVDRTLSVGIIILIAIIGFFIFCISLFCIRWWILRQKFKKKNFFPEHLDGSGADPKTNTREAYEMDNGSSCAKSTADEFKNESGYEESTVGSERTRIESAYIVDEVTGIQPPDSRTPRNYSPTCPTYAQLTSSPSSEEQTENTDLTPRRSLSSRHGSPKEHDEDHPSGRHTWLHSRSFSTSSAAASSFHEEFSMAGVGARNSIASSSSNKEVRPRIQEDAYRSISLSISPVTRLGDELGPILSDDMLE